MDERYVVGWGADPFPPRLVRLQRVASVIFIGLGALVAAMEVTVLVLLVLKPESRPKDTAFVVIGGLVWSSVFLYSGIHGAVANRRIRTGDWLRTRPPYAFAVSWTSLDFPASQTRAAETWNRATTRADVIGSGLARTIRLRCPGHRTRGFATRALSVPAEQILALLRVDQRS